MKIQELYLKTMQCGNRECMSRVRVGRALYLPSATVDTLKFCPVCGSEANAIKDDNEDYMEILAETFGITVDLLKQIMAVWDRNKYQRLSQFIDALRTTPVEDILSDEAKIA